MNVKHVDVVLPLTTDASDTSCFLKAQSIIQVCRPEWIKSVDGLQCEYFNLGMTNRILSCWHESTGNKDRVLLRIFGENTELLINRDDELKFMLLTYKHGLGVPVYASFNNGLAYGFLPGNVLTRETIKDKHIASLIAKKMAQMHMITPDDASTPKSCIFDKIQDYINNLPQFFEDEATQEKYSTEWPSQKILVDEAAFMKELIDTLHCKIVLCHNDLLINNVIYDEDTDSVSFIDYEYGGWNFQGFDIGDHFCEYVGMDDNIDWSLYPSKDMQIWWIVEYLNEWHSLNNLPSPTDCDIQKLHVQVTCLAPLAHLVWSIWSVIQAKHSSIQFDYMQYAIDRYSQYHRLKNIALSLLDETKI